MQWPRVDMGLNWVGAIAFRLFATWKISHKLFQSSRVLSRHHVTSWNPSLSFFIPDLYVCSFATGDIKSRIVSTTFWSTSSWLSNRLSYPGKLHIQDWENSHMPKGSICLNHASGASAASGPNTVNVFPLPLNPYANMTTLPCMFLNLEPVAASILSCPINSMSSARL